MLPYYVAIGMTVEQFWYDDPYLAVVYREANKIQAERRNQEMWWQGMYIHAAFAIALGNVFRKKGAKPKEYLQEPIRITPMSEEEKEWRAEEERKKTIAFFNRLAKNMKKE